VLPFRRVSLLHRAGPKPLNRLQPDAPPPPEFEQRGCLHANMDLYKWAFKLAPFTPAELIADCFALARDIREVDMRASPYDLGQARLSRRSGSRPPRAAPTTSAPARLSPPAASRCALRLIALLERLLARVD
jgi:hypothetical protein